MATMEFIVGRDKETRQLRVTLGTQSKLFGTAGSVPEYVSRQHAKLITNGDGHYTIVNLNPDNHTYVNGVRIESKQVTEADKVDLGPTHYKFDWNALTPLMPNMVDISTLEPVWEEYHATKMKNQVAERKFNALRSATGVITMGAMVMSMFGGRGPLFIAMYVLAIGITLFFTIKAYISSSKVPEQNERLDKQFKRDYVCPNPKCRHFMGFNAYDVLSQNKQCPYCKAQYIKKS